MELEELLKVLKLEEPVIAVYDSPEYEAFQPVVRPKPNECVWASYKAWREGKTLVLSRDKYGCRGAARFLLGMKFEGFDLAKFLYEGEGLNATLDITKEWIKNQFIYFPKHEYILIGPFKEEFIDRVISITFLVYPDQLSALIHGALYFTSEAIPDIIKTTASAACALLAPFSKKNGEPQAFIGATDMAMRRYIPECLLAFTVNKSMFQQLLSLDEKCFLYKPFWKRLLEMRRK